MKACLIARLIVVALAAISLAACRSRHAPASPAASSPGSAGPAAPTAPAVPIVKPADFQATLTTKRRMLMSSGRRVSPDEIGYYMDVQQARLQQISVQGISVVRKGQSVRLSLPGRWSFKVGSADLAPSAQSALSSIARILADYHLSLITVHGHTDDAGNPEFNQTLSEKRALAVARHLVSGGISLDRILVVGHGAAEPRVSNATADGREANRRVELQIDPLTEKMALLSRD